MRSCYKIFDHGPPHFLTHTVVAWVPVFTRRPYFDLILQTLSFCRQNKGLKLFAWVVLDNHMHLLVSGDQVPKIMKEFKSFTAREVIRLAQEDRKDWLLTQFKVNKLRHKNQSAYQVWQEGHHPQLIATEQMLRQKIEYIHQNPVTAGLVDNLEDWPYSSARNYLGLKGLLEIDALEV
ncbi:MAG: REP-associated tyrosine transposase [Thermodesulfobacteriota bacterium]